MRGQNLCIVFFLLRKKSWAKGKDEKKREEEKKKGGEKGRKGKRGEERTIRGRVVG